MEVVIALTFADYMDKEEGKELCFARAMKVLAFDTQHLQRR
jgi:hypothetical protein